MQCDIGYRLNERLKTDRGNPVACEAGTYIKARSLGLFHHFDLPLETLAQQ